MVFLGNISSRIARKTLQVRKWGILQKKKKKSKSLSSQHKFIKKIYFEVQLTTHNSLRGGDHLQAFKWTTWIPLNTHTPLRCINVVRLERYTHFLSVWCEEGNLHMTKMKTLAYSLHTHTHPCISITHTQPSPQSRRAALPVQWWFSMAVELHTVALSSILHRCTRSCLLRFSLSVCLSVPVSLFLCLTHTFFCSRTVLHTYARSHKSQGERVSVRVSENKGN